MGELGGTVEYLYWSARRTSRFIEDNSLSVEPVTRTLTSPSFGWLPTFSRSETSANGKRPQIARTIERSLGKIAVTSFGAPGPIQYAKGTSTVVFGRFVTWGKRTRPTRRPAVIFTSMDYDRRDRDSVAVCLFGSMDNFPEYVQSAGPGYAGDGWISSSAPAVYDFIKSHGKEYCFPCETPEEMASNALWVADGQGIYLPGSECDYGTVRPWKRSFTYGDSDKAQWLAQIYLDVDLVASGLDREDGFRRILVGAPLWIRTPAPRPARLYADTDDPEIQSDRFAQAQRRRRLGRGPLDILDAADPLSTTNSDENAAPE
jgi:hypothetical protein